MTYEEVLDRINNARRFGKLPGVEVAKVMLEKMGHPELGLPFAHVAGTNGKGSVCAFLSSILQTAGIKTGVFTSPHLIDFEERITVNGALIPKADVCRLGNLLLATDFGVEPTMFDYCLVMAILYFKEQGCQFMIIETGLGGRLDSTNAIGTPEVAVITKIGFDHMDILGDNLEQIASEKAGIIKRDCPVILQRQEPEAEKVLMETYRKVNKGNDKSKENLFLVSEQEIAQTRAMNLKMIGVHQWENAAAAMLAARALLRDCACEKVITEQTPSLESCIRIGLERATWPGRMEIISSRPFLLVDGAHNGHGTAALAESLRTLYPGERFHLIMGVMADKDYENMIGELLPLAEEFVTFTPESSRALQGKELAECIRRRDIPAKACSNLKDVMESLRPDIRNIAFGSLYFIGDIKNYVAHLR